MLKDIIAKRYAKALLSLAEQGGQTEVVKKDLSAVAELYKNSKNLQSVIMNPVFSTSDKSKVLKGLSAEIKVSALSARFLDLMIEKGRFRYIREAAAAYADLLDIKQGRVKATVTSAAALSPADIDRLKAKIKAAVGKDVELNAEIDPSLIGGIRTKIGSTIYDGSLKHQVGLVREALLKS